MLKMLTALIAAGALALPLAAEEAVARDLYLSDAGIGSVTPIRGGDAQEPEATQPHTGLEIGVEVFQQSRAPRMLSPAEHLFSAGEKARLHIKSNTEGQVYLVQVKANGQAERLLPSLTGGVDGRVSPSKAVIYPAQGFLLFDASDRAEETIYVYFVKNDPAAEAMLTAIPEVGAVVPESAAPTVKRNTQEFEKNLEVASRDLLLSTGNVHDLQPAKNGKQPEAGEASFVVSKTPGASTLAATVVLKRK